MVNIYKQAYEIITTKTCEEMTDEEVELVSGALGIMINELPKVEPIYDKLPISLGLLRLAKITEGG